MASREEGETSDARNSSPRNKVPGSLASILRGPGISHHGASGTDESTPGGRLPLGGLVAEGVADVKLVDQNEGHGGQGGGQDQADPADKHS